MSLRWAILGSGSEANCYLFQGDEGTLVVDAGFPLKTFKKRAHKAGLDPALVKLVLLTHTHGDHVKGLENLLAYSGAPLVHRRGLKIEAVIRRLKDAAYIPVDTQTSLQVAGFDFYPFELSHDAPLSTGYHFKVGGTRFTLITDTGKTDETMLRLAARSDILFLESNYCPTMLAAGPYPAVLRNRVSGDQGHLSNHQAADFLNALADLRAEGTGATSLRQVYLIHVSDNNNTVDRVTEVMKDECRWSGPIRVCGRSELVVGDDPAEES